jgi:DNA-binding XRE family transcriptional regulator
MMQVTTEDMATWLRTVRGVLGLSQAKFARLLGVSARAIQSYEQGWRNMPRPLVAHVMTVLAIYCDHPAQSPSCWSLTGCPEEARSRCTAFTLGRGHFCWLLTGTTCGKSEKTACASGSQPCIGCVVIKKMLDKSARPKAASAG